MPSTSAVADLNWFQIKGNGLSPDKTKCSVYKNGRHQLRVTVIIKALDANGHSISLSVDQMKKVELIDYSSGAKIPSHFVRSYASEGYDEKPANLLANDEEITAENSTLDIWLSANSSAPVTTLQIAAKITLDNVPYYTNNPLVEPGGKMLNGQSNSSIHAEILGGYTLTASSFTVSETGRIPDGKYKYKGSAPRKPSRDFYLWKIAINNGIHRILKSDIPLSSFTNWFSQYVKGGSGIDTCHYILPVRPQPSGGIWLGYLSSGEHDMDVVIWPYHNPEAVAWAVIEWGQHFENSHYVSKKIRFTDNYGWEHDIYLKPNDNGKEFKLE